MEFENDEYTLDIESLGSKEQIDNIRELIINANPPYSIGVSGRWGSGKTSIMKFLFASLGGKPVKHSVNFEDLEENNKFSEVYEKCKDKNENERTIHCIWFNPWENESHKEPMIALLQEIHNHFSILSKAKETGKKTISIVMQSGLDMLQSYLKISEKNLNDNSIFKHKERNTKFKLIFKEAIKRLLKGVEKYAYNCLK